MGVIRDALRANRLPEDVFYAELMGNAGFRQEELMGKRYFSAPEAARELANRMGVSVSRITAWRYMRHGKNGIKLAATLVGNSFVTDAESIEEFVRRISG